MCVDDMKIEVLNYRKPYIKFDRDSIDLSKSILQFHTFYVFCQTSRFGQSNESIRLQRLVFLQQHHERTNIVHIASSSLRGAGLAESQRAAPGQAAALADRIT